MRRVVCVILFLIGGYVLSGELIMSSLDVGEGVVEQLGMAGIMAAFAAPFLLLGTWASPGNRFAELGLTLMIVAGLGAFIALIMFMLTHDPSFKQLMPPDKPMPQIHFAWLFGLANLVVIASGGYLLRRFAKQREQGEKPELQEIFD